MAKKKSYRDLEREIIQLRTTYKPAIQAFRDSAEKVLHEVTNETAHAVLGQVILEQIVKDVAYKKITAGEAKLWLEQKWAHRHEVSGEFNEQCDFLGLDPDELRIHFRELSEFIERKTGDRAIQLYSLAYQEQLAEGIQWQKLF